MRIIALGGAGDMGSRAVEELAEAEGVEQVLHRPGYRPA